MDLEVRHLRALLALAEAGSITGAAARLGVPQPALSRQLRRIETRLGQQLFVRSRTGLSATAAGAAFLVDARRVVAAFDRLARSEPEPPPTPDTLRVATYCLPVEAVIHRHRDELGIAAVVGHNVGAQAAVDGVAAGEVDLAVVNVWPHVPELRVPGHVRRVVGVTVTLRVMMHHLHRLAGRPEIDLADLRDENWVSRHDVPTTTVECAIAGFQARITHHHDDQLYYFDLVGSGACVALCLPTMHTTDRIVIRRYRGASDVTWQFFHDPSRLTAATVEDVIRVVARRHHEVLVSTGQL